MNFLDDLKAKEVEVKKHEINGRKYSIKSKANLSIATMTFNHYAIGYLTKNKVKIATGEEGQKEVMTTYLFQGDAHGQHLRTVYATSILKALDGADVKETLISDIEAMIEGSDYSVEEIIVELVIATNDDMVKIMSEGKKK